MRAPVLAAIFLIVTLATLAMPGSANFVGEFYILIGVFQAKIVFAFVAAIGVMLAAYYAIRLFQRTMHGRKPDGITSREIGLRDALVVAPLAACIVGLALYPGLILGRSDAAVKDKIAATARAVQPTPSAGRFLDAFVPHSGTKASIAAPYPASNGFGARHVRGQP
jgi:NADH-quinone oxidoreductase subunit M